jgi:hypothetical protein
MFYYYLLFTFFAFLIYAMVIDENVSIAIVLFSKLIKIKVETFYWQIKLHPKNPITNIKKYWEYDKIARQLHSELNKSKEK